MARPSASGPGRTGRSGFSLIGSPRPGRHPRRRRRCPRRTTPRPAAHRRRRRARGRRRRRRGPGARRDRRQPSVVVVVLLDEHDDPLPHPVQRPLRGELLDQGGEPLDPLRDDPVGQLVVEVLGLGAVLVGVAEHADDVEPSGGEEALELVDVVLGLAREADDDVAAHPGERLAGPDLLDQPEEGLGAAEPAHPAQHGGRGVLEGQVVPRHDAGRARPSPRAARGAPRPAAGRTPAPGRRPRRR